MQSKARRIETLYQELFDAEKKNKSTSQIRSQIQQVLREESSGIERFFENLYKKPFVKVFEKIVKEQPIEDVYVAKALSSYITHVLIEMERDPTVFQDLSLTESTLLLHQFVSGDIENAQVTSFIRENFRCLA